MANQSSDDEVFDFSNTEFTREDLITALNEMVQEYRKLSQKLEEVKAENVDLKNSSVEPRSVQLGETDSLQVELSKLKAENDSLRLRSSELKAENERLNEVMSSWTKSSVSLSKLHEAQKPLNDKSGLGFNVGESSAEKTSTQSHLVCDKFKKTSFVKASVIYDSCESVRYDDQNSSKLNQKGKAGIGYLRLENSKTSWLENRLDKDKAKVGSKSFVSHQPRRSSKKVPGSLGSILHTIVTVFVPSVWRKVHPRRDLNGQTNTQQILQYFCTDPYGLSYWENCVYFFNQSYVMASSLISNTNQVYFASVLAMDNAGMVDMFEALVASGLNGFLGCFSDIYEAALVEFFQNASVRDGQVISTVQGKLVEISEEVFARTFQLPVEGLMDLNEVPKDLVFDARSVFSFMVTVKAGSVDAVTHERFFMVTAIYGGIKNLELGDSKERGVGLSRVRKTPAKKVASKKQSAAASEAPVVKKKRTYSGKAVSKEKDLAIVSVALDAKPIKTVDPTSAMPVVHHPTPKRKAPKRKLRMTAGFDDESVAKEQAVEDAVLQQKTTISVDDVDNIITQVITETTQMDTDVEEPVGSRADTIPEIGEKVVDETVVRGTDDTAGEGGSSRPQPPPDDQSRPSGGSGSRDSGGDGSSQRRDRGGSSKKRHSSSSGGVHHNSGGGGPVGPIRRDAEYWICGKRQF
ncbi:filament-like plant protein 7 [Dorcoceras hygrometricum]|uniref:Filament-like plant protein 7 n=1 Tax=Dorcoceras hygrometricum TaxID=472368 RepID=A0A2Z7B8I3_9LAMI|nr:filament-like plant protein 7 [Dorcoceras hygrometricum]